MMGFALSALRTVASTASVPLDLPDASLDNFTVTCSASRVALAVSASAPMETIDFV